MPQPARRRRPLGLRIAAAFALLIALFLGSGLVTLNGLSGIDSSTKQLTERSVPYLDSLAAATTEAKATANDERGYLMTADKDFVDEIAGRRKEIAEHFKHARAVAPDAKLRAAIDTVEKDFNAWNEAVDGEFKLYATDRPGAIELALGANRDLRKAYEASIESARASAAKTVTAARADAAGTVASSHTTTIVVLLVAVVVAIGVAYLLTRSVVRPVRQILGAAEGIAEGDLDQRLDVRSNDEVGDMAAAFERMVDSLQVTAGVADRIADGDLTVEANPRSDADVLGNAFARMLESLRAIVGRVATSATSLTDASQQMAAASEQTGAAIDEIAGQISEVADGAERQVQRVAQVRTATEQVAASGREGTASAQEVSRSAATARDVAREGEEVVTAAMGAMTAVRDNAAEAASAIGDLSAKSERIGAIVETISGIAEQTNLLALNAAIEAARAGEQGRGFAVVAEEVRKLAEESQAAVATIGALIGEIQDDTTRAVAVTRSGGERTDEGAATVARARESFLAIGGAVADMDARVRDITEAVERITSASEAVLADVEDVAAVAEQSSSASQHVAASTQETSASAQEIGAAATELARTAEELNELVGRFTLA
jgi:methyl-accepting chemotaxis protein